MDRLRSRENTSASKPSTIPPWLRPEPSIDQRASIGEPEPRLRKVHPEHRNPMPHIVSYVERRRFSDQREDNDKVLETSIAICKRIFSIHHYKPQEARDSLAKWGIDPDEYYTAFKKLEINQRLLKDKKIITHGDINQLINEFKEDYKTLSDFNDKLCKEEPKLLINEKVQDARNKVNDLLNEINGGIIQYREYALRHNQ